MGVDSMTGNILNAGTLMGKFWDGFSAYSGSSIAGNITNTATGTIIGGEAGINLGNATTATTGTTAYSGLTGTIINNGIINSTNLMQTGVSGNTWYVGAGIRVGRLGTLTGGIVNTGTIGGTAEVGIHIYNENALGFITTAGTATHSIQPTQLAANTANVSGRIINSGLISSASTITIAGQAVGAGIMIGTRGFVTQGIENNVGGSIIGAGQAGAAGIVLTPRFTLVSTTTGQLPVLTTKIGRAHV